MTAPPVTASRPPCRTPAHPPAGAASTPTGAGAITASVSPPVSVPAAVPPTTASSPFVTLQPASPGGGIPGDASDGADFYGLGAALVGIVLVIVLARLVLRGQRSPGRQSRGER